MPRKKPGPGHPVTTGMATARPVHFRVTAAQRAELDAEGEARGISGDLVAKGRVFARRVPVSRKKQAKS